MGLTISGKGCMKTRGEGGARPPPPDFGRSVNPVLTPGGQIMPTNYFLPPPPRFLALPTFFIRKRLHENEFWQLTQKYLFYIDIDFRWVMGLLTRGYKIRHIKGPCHYQTIINIKFTVIF